jgi:ribose transport system substrate-binding protein
MRRRIPVASAMIGAFALIAFTGCTTDPNVAAPTDDAAETEEAVEWFDQALFDEQDEQRGIEPVGPADQPWLQMIAPEEMVDTRSTRARVRRRPASRTPRSPTHGGRPAGSP